MNHQNLFAGAQRVGLAIALIALSGCSSLKGQLENRVVMSTDCGAVFALSLYGPIGLSGKAADRDAAPILAALCRAPAAK